MPIYEYECEDCGERFEVWFRSSTQAKDVRCESCKSSRVARRMSAPAVLHTGTKETGPKPGELRPADGRMYTGKLADGYAKGTGDTAIGEVARQVERGDSPGQVQEFVRGVKDERQTAAKKKRGTPT
jgi:putative FmdB family regulatory protein